VIKAEQEAAQGEAANPGKLERFFNTMGTMIPDILEVTVTILQNPFKGPDQARKDKFTRLAYLPEFSARVKYGG
jgi:hypothetical protein